MLSLRPLRPTVLVAFVSAVAAFATPLTRAAGEPPTILQVDGALAVQADRLEVDVVAGEATRPGTSP